MTLRRTGRDGQGPPTTMDSFFFRVDHDLLRSEAFKTLGGSAIKVYLVLGLYSDFGTGWAYPSIRTIAKQAGLSRQTVIDAITELARSGLLATNKVPGRSTAYKLVQQGPERPSSSSRRKAPKSAPTTGPISFRVTDDTGPESCQVEPETGPDSGTALARFLGLDGPESGPEREPTTRSGDNISIPIPGTPFRMTADGRLLVSVDVRELLTSQGLPAKLATSIAAQREPEDVAKVLLNALYLQSQGKLQNGPGYIRAAIEDGYELLPQVANRLEARRRELQEHLRAVASRREESDQDRRHREEEEAVELLIESLRPDALQRLVDQAVASLPEPIVRRNRTLSNPFVRSKVYELAGGVPLD